MVTNVALTFYIALLSLGFANAYPSRRFDLVVAPRQVVSTTIAAPMTSPTTITTTNIIQTPNGPMTETCSLTFTQVGDQVQEVKNCSVIAPSPIMGISVTPSPGSSSASLSTLTPQAAFALPGRSIQVLPVGLGIFGSITGITIIIVAVVTLERVRYRKVFRERRLAEQGGMVGYGANFRGKV